MDKREQTEIISLVGFMIIIILVLSYAKVSYQYTFFIAVVAFVIGMLSISRRRKKRAS